MKSANISIEYLRASGARTKTRLRELVQHFSSFYHDDCESAFTLAMSIAKRTVFNFDEGK